VAVVRRHGHRFILVKGKSFGTLSFPRARIPTETVAAKDNATLGLETVRQTLLACHATHTLTRESTQVY
jgi:hypothetical protein